MKNTTFINVVSGKGGTGKTLLCTIMAELLGNQNLNVLIIDMDIFVRGLTALLYFHKGESLKLINDNELTVSDIFYKHLEQSDRKLAIHKYRSFDISPAVSRINQIFEYEKQMIFDYRHNETNFNRIIEMIPLDRYDYVFFDCRAGYDSLVSTVHEHSDITICVQEEDDISEVTANNLIRQLERDSSRKSIFKLVNKARHVKSFDDLEKKQNQGLTFLGYIPFDMDVMNSFGERTFWDEISKSLYKSAVAEAWNKLAIKAELKDTVYFRRYSPLVNNDFERPFAFLKSQNRITALLGLMTGMIGLIYIFIGRELSNIIKEQPDLIIGFITALFGFSLFVFSVLDKRKK